MTNDIIKALLYAEASDEFGPNPRVCLPNTFSNEVLMHIVIKIITVLTGEKGFIPQSIVILPFPSLNLKGLVKYIKWKDPYRRGGIGQSAITLLFREMDDVIFYKYINLFNPYFDEISKKIINFEKLNFSEEIYPELLQEFKDKLSNLIDDLKIKETTQVSTVEFPEQKIKDAGLIDYKFKIAIVGDPGVGKTSLILRYTDNAFRRTYIPTLGVHVSDKIFNIKNSVIQLVLWDIAGQVKFETMRQQFYLGTDGIFLVFDLTNQKSFENISHWYFDIKKQLKNRSDLIGYIIGNKNDLIGEESIKSEDAIKLGNFHNLDYVETSALTGENVDSAFNNLANKLYTIFK